MKKISHYLIIGFVSLVLLAGCKTSANTDIPPGYVMESFKVEGMYCSSCASGIESYFKTLTGVSDAKLSYMFKTGYVTYDPSQIQRQIFIESAQPYPLIFNE